MSRDRMDRDRMDRERMGHFTMNRPFIVGTRTGVHSLWSTILAAATLAAPALPAPAAAQEWRLQLGTGAAYNVPARLDVQQDGGAPIALTARYDTRPFATPLYYVIRVERAGAGHALALELIHHKLFLTNGPPEVQRFEISHGFNVVTLQHAWEPHETVHWRVGAGVIVAHPETTVRGRAQPKGGWLDRGYYVAGPAAQVAAGASRRVIGRIRVGLEAKATGARAWVPIADGSARLWHASAHLDALVSAGL